MNFVLPVAGLALIGYFVYKATTLTMKQVYVPRPTRPDDIGSIAEYQFVSDAYQDPRNTISNDKHIPILRQEEGEFGCPRTIYLGGERGSNIMAYGDFYRKF